MKTRGAKGSGKRARNQGGSVTAGGRSGFEKTSGEGQIVCLVFAGAQYGRSAGAQTCRSMHRPAATIPSKDPRHNFRIIAKDTAAHAPSSRASQPWSQASASSLPALFEDMAGHALRLESAPALGAALVMKVDGGRAHQTPLSSRKDRAARRVNHAVGIARSRRRRCATCSETWETEA